MNVRFVVFFVFPIFLVGLINAVSIVVPAAACNGESLSETQGNFSLSCTTSGLSADDGSNATFSFIKQGPTSKYAGINTSNYNASITSCGSVSSVFACYKWWVTSSQVDSCDVSVGLGNANYSNFTTTCPGTSEPGSITCANVTSLKAWNCSNFFGSSGTRASLKSEVFGTGPQGDSIWDVLYYNVTYLTSAPSGTAPSDQTVELGNETTLAWSLTGDGGFYYVLRNGTLFDGPSTWSSGVPIIVRPLNYFLGAWNYTLVFNDSSGINGTPSSAFVTVVDNVSPSCSDVIGQNGTITSASISIDGIFSDWKGVLSNPSNYVNDLTKIQGDTDPINTNDRDGVVFATTYDSQFLNFYFKRTVRGSRQVSMIVYLDYDLDGYMNSTDKVVKFFWFGTRGVYTSDFYNYVPQNAGGDLMLGSGSSMNGSITLNRSIESAVPGGSALGTELESRVRWSDLGLSSSRALRLKASSAVGSGTNLPSQIEDNIGPVISTRNSFLLFKQDKSKAAVNGSSVYYDLDLGNCGNSLETIELSNASSQGWSITVYNASGSVITDSNSNGKPDVSLNGSGFSIVVVKVSVPGSATGGTLDRANVTANSSTNTKTVYLNTSINQVAVTPKLMSIIGSAGMNAALNVTIFNYQTFSDVVKLSSSSGRGWSVVLQYFNGSNLTDTNSDGFLDLGTMQPRESKDLRVVIQIPSNESIGANDTVTIRVNSSVLSNVFDSATISSNVSNRLIFLKNFTGAVSAGVSYIYFVNVTNNWNQTDVFDISNSSVQNWSVIFLSLDQVSRLNDSNGNGFPDISIAGYGEVKGFYIRLDVPLNASQGSTEISIIFVNSSLNSSVYGRITLNSTLKAALAYNDSARTNIQTRFEVFNLTSNTTVFGRAHTVQDFAQVLFTWFNMNGSVYKQFNSTVSGNSADDEVNLSLASVGQWTFIVFNSSDNSEISRREFSIIESVRPNVSLSSPSNGSNYSILSTVELAVNASDNVEVDSVLANVTFPNGTIKLVMLDYSSNSKYNNSFAIPSLTGQYNVTFTVFDFGSNNNTLSAYFVSEADAVSPFVLISSPSNNSFFNSSSLQFNFTVTDNLAATFACNLTVDGVLNQTSSSVSNNTLTTFSASGFASGVHYWNVSCADGSGNGNASAIRRFTVDAIPPSLLVNGPSNNSAFRVQNVSFNFTVFDNAANSSSCSLVIDNSINQTNSSIPNNTVAIFQVSGLSQGSHAWRANCTDFAGNSNTSSTFSFVVDTINPNITILSPINSTYSQNVALNISVSDNVALGSCWYSLGAGNVSIANCQNLTISSLSAGNYNLTVFVNDSVGNLNYSNVSFSVETTAPLWNPVPSDQNVSYGVAFNYTVNATDNLTITYSINDTANFVINSTTGLIRNATVLPVNTYYLKINATDSAGNVNSTTIRIIVTGALGSLTIFKTIAPYDPTVNVSNVSINMSLSNNSLATGFSANLSLPNGTIISLSLPYNYTPTLIGRYNVTFIASLVNGSILTATGYFISGPVPINMQFNVVNNNLSGVTSNLTIYFAGTNDIVINTAFNGSKVDPHSAILYDLHYSVLSGDLLVRLNDINASLDFNRTLYVDKNNTVSGYLVTFGVTTDYSFTNATLRFNYSGTGFSNANSLKLFKCNSWNFTTRVCSSSWTDITSQSINDASSQYFETNVSSFSGFSIEQPATTTTSTSSGGGSGSPIAPSNVSCDNCTPVVNKTGEAPSTPTVESEAKPEAGKEAGKPVESTQSKPLAKPSATPRLPALPKQEDFVGETPAEVRGAAFGSLLLPLSLFSAGIAVVAILLFLWFGRGYTIYVSSGPIGPNDVVLSEKLLEDFKLRVGDKVSIGLERNSASGTIARIPEELRDPKSPAKGSGKYMVFGDNILKKLALELSKSRDTRGLGFDKFKPNVGVKIKKI